MKRFRKLLGLALFFVAVLVGGAYQQSQSASLTNVSVTVSNSRLSFVGALDSGNAAGSSQVIIDTTPGDWPSTTSAYLMTGDVLSIGDAGTMSNYTATSFVSDGQLNVTPVLGTGDVEAGDAVISTQSAVHTVRFTTANAVTDGSFRILVPSRANDAHAADGMPDADAFDFGNSAPTVTCPTNLTGYTFGAATAVASTVTISGQDYHAYTCPYTGAGAIGTAFDGTTNDAITIDDIINPAPVADHFLGLADSYRIIVQHRNNGGTVVDSTTVSVGIIEAVRVTATVSPQITFQISGIASSTTACGIATDVSTTALAVPLGELSISSFVNAAQSLAVSTNASNGYVVTAIANDQLGRNGGACTGDNTGGNCIPDSIGDTSTMTHATPDEWVTTSVKGFGFSLDNANGTGMTPAFEYDSTAGGCDGAFCAKQFADAENSQAPQSIFSSSTVADLHNTYVCYQAIISSTQAAGEYENHITYTATATF